MTIGSKSILFGYNQFVLRPLIIALAWWKLYGFPYDPRLWCSFFIYKLGYIGRSNINDEYSKFPAKIMGYIFGEYWYNFVITIPEFQLNVITNLSLNYV
jgi:hypothetical protein